jgi:methyl halide transferase
MKKNDPTMRRAILTALATACVLLTVFMTVIQAEPPTVEEFPALVEVGAEIDQFVFDNMLIIDEEADKDEVIREISHAPKDASVLAFEENGKFLAATIQSPKDLSRQYVRRIFLLKPSLLLIDDLQTDFLSQSDPPTARLRDNIEFNREGLQHAVDDQELTVRFNFLGVEDDVTRSLSAFLLAETGAAESLDIDVEFDSIASAVATVTLGDRVYTLTLPAPGTDIGGARIAIRDAEGNSILDRRPLPAGVLPHGPEGNALIERWDSAYRDGKRPPWDARITAPELARVVEEKIEPCRAVVLGCGSGDNAIYLASKGFDVTAIDVAPTALGIAEKKAEEAGVEINWVLSDVLAIPADLEPFDFVFDRGCYHHIHYYDPEGFVETLNRITNKDALCLILSCNRDNPPGIREPDMREDFSDTFDIEWLEPGGLAVRESDNQNSSWSLMLKSR